LEKIRKFNPTSTLIRSGFALAITFLLSQFGFDYIEALFFDARVRLKPVSPVSNSIALIAVDPPTIEKLGRAPSAADHLLLLKKLRKSNPRAVIYLLNPNDIVGSAQELEDLADEMMTIPDFHVGVQDVAMKGEKQGLSLLPPFSKVSAQSAPATTDRSIFAGDNVTRRMLISYQGDPTLYQKIAGLLNPEVLNESSIRGHFEYLGSTQTYIDFRPRGTYPIISFATVMDHNFNLNLNLNSKATPIGSLIGNLGFDSFRDKIVIVGRDIHTTSKDYVQTPFQRDVIAMTLLELNANMLDTLILNSSPVRTPAWLDILLTALISLLTVYVVFAVPPTRGLTILALTIGALFLLSFLTFWLGHIWIGMARPFLAIFICYYFFIPYRLIMENRRSWEYYQKNRLLTQVEELKTNFLSMMSHDLKTPIARIQGMTDIVRNDPNGLSQRQNEAIETLSQSTQELLEFISSILNLGRIESKELKLHLVSRDPNSLLSEVIEKLEYMAKPRKIEIKAELEPMFSLKMDVDLMRQVFTNLIENAIKYSPDNSRILVTADEQDGRVVIQVADQGMGVPEEELPHVFSKFYRSKKAKTSTIKGSGLGLYLAKYFVELHKGTISADSRVGEGSTFTIELPTSTGGELNASSISSR
jgi:signal transduction histidine kinase